MAGENNKNLKSPKSSPTKPNHKQPPTLTFNSLISSPNITPKNSNNNLHKTFPSNIIPMSSPTKEMFSTQTPSSPSKKNNPKTFSYQQNTHITNLSTPKLTPKGSDHDLLSSSTSSYYSSTSYSASDTSHGIVSGYAAQFKKKSNSNLPPSLSFPKNSKSSKNRSSFSLSTYRTISTHRSTSSFVLFEENKFLANVRWGLQFVIQHRRREAEFQDCFNEFENVLYHFLKHFFVNGKGVETFSFRSIYQILSDGIIYILLCEILFEEQPDAIESYLLSNYCTNLRTHNILLKWITKKGIIPYNISTNQKITEQELSSFDPFLEDVHESLMECLLIKHINSVTIENVMLAVKAIADEFNIHVEMPVRLDDALLIWFNCISIAYFVSTVENEGDNNSVDLEDVPLERELWEATSNAKSIMKAILSYKPDVRLRGFVDTLNEDANDLTLKERIEHWEIIIDVCQRELNILPSFDACTVASLTDKEKNNGNQELFKTNILAFIVDLFCLLVYEDEEEVKENQTETCSHLAESQEEIEEKITDEKRGIKSGSVNLKVTENERTALSSSLTSKKQIKGLSHIRESLQSLSSKTKQNLPIENVAKSLQTPKRFTRENSIQEEIEEVQPIRVSLGIKKLVDNHRYHSSISSSVQEEIIEEDINDDTEEDIDVEDATIEEEIEETLLLTRELRNPPNLLDSMVKISTGDTIRNSINREKVTRSKDIIANSQSLKSLNIKLDESFAVHTVKERERPELSTLELREEGTDLKEDQVEEDEINNEAPLSDKENSEDIEEMQDKSESTVELDVPQPVTDSIKIIKPQEEIPLEASIKRNKEKGSREFNEKLLFDSISLFKEYKNRPMVSHSASNIPKNNQSQESIRISNIFNNPSNTTTPLESEINVSEVEKVKRENQMLKMQLLQQQRMIDESKKALKQRLEEERQRMKQQVLEEYINLAKNNQGKVDDSIERVKTPQAKTTKSIEAENRNPKTPLPPSRKGAIIEILPEDFENSIEYKKRKEIRNKKFEAKKMEMEERTKKENRVAVTTPIKTPPPTTVIKEKDIEKASAVTPTQQRNNSGDTSQKTSKQQVKINKLLIKNALTHLCLAGEVNKKERDEVLQSMQSYEDTCQLILLVREFNVPVYRALYAIVPAQPIPNQANSDSQYVVKKIHGKGPKNLNEESIEIYCRYDSGSKKLIQLASKGFGVTTDVVVFHSYVNKNKKINK
ncbi:hypothetical protein ABK040_011158 [Willaertia magna]